MASRLEKPRIHACMHTQMKRQVRNMLPSASHRMRGRHIKHTKDLIKTWPSCKPRPNLTEFKGKENLKDLLQSSRSSPYSHQRPLVVLIHHNKATVLVGNNQCCCPWPWSLALRCPRGQILSPWPWRSSPWPWAKVLGLSDITISEFKICYSQWQIKYENHELILKQT